MLQSSGPLLLCLYLYSHMRWLLITCGILLNFGLAAQPLSEDARFFLVTCDPGEAVYELHGHSAIRVLDESSNVDAIFNWGIFDPGDSEMDFSITFAKGKMDYELQRQPLEWFLSIYQAQGREVRQQELNLNEDQKRKMWENLLLNDTPGKRKYRYDFFFKNCATLCRDAVADVGRTQLKWGSHLEAGKRTFRELIDDNLQYQPWSDFGIDLALGSRIDRNVQNEELMFLPLKMEEIFASSSINGQPLVLESTILSNGTFERKKPGFWGGPNFTFWGLLLMGIALWFFKMHKAQVAFDILFFTVMAFTGFLILFLWFGTEHTTTDKNYNLIWASPLHLMMPLLLVFAKLRLRFNKVFLAMSVLCFGFILFGMLLPQTFNDATKPIALLLGLRYYYWYKRTKSVVLPS